MAFGFDLFIIRQAEGGTTPDARNIVKDSATRQQRKITGVLTNYRGAFPAGAEGRFPCAWTYALERPAGLEYKREV
jgi:hypothetical protein